MLPAVAQSVAVKSVAVPVAQPFKNAALTAFPPKAATLEYSALFDGSRLRPAASVPEAPQPRVTPPPSRERFSDVIDRLVSSRRFELVSLSAQYASASPEDRKALDSRIQKIVDEINVLKVPSGKRESDLVASAPDFLSDDFAATPAHPRYRADAESRLLAGEYLPQFVYAGAATRLLQDFEEVLGRKLDPLPYRMYGLDLWETLRHMRALDDASLLKLFEGQKVPDARGLIERLRAVKIPANARALGMGPRQILAYTTLLSRLARERGLKASAVLKRQRPVFHLNEEIADSVLRDFEKNDFYGFDRDKVVFIIQPIFKGYRLEEGGAALAEESPALPYGHGYATTQLKYPDAFTLGADGAPRPLAGSFLDEAIAADANGRFVLATHRINDATKFDPERVVDLDNLALSLSLLDEGHGITIDLVGNPNKQKGGNNVRYAGETSSFLIETSNSKGSPVLTALLNAAADDNAPYNAFRLTSTPAAYRRLLDEGIPYNLRFKNGFFYLESVTGDLTQLPASRSVAVQKRGELIHDFKQLANLLDALDFVARQDLAAKPGRRVRKP